MDLSRIRPETVALAVASALMLLVGTYTDNGGFQAAGVIVAVVATVVAFNQARGFPFERPERRVMATSRHIGGATRSNSFARSPSACFRRISTKTTGRTETDPLGRGGCLVL